MSERMKKTTTEGHQESRLAAEAQNSVSHAPELFRMPFGWEVLGVDAGCTGRRGGVSLPPYESLNMSFSRKDAVENVLENHLRVARELQCLPVEMVRARQVHGARVERVSRAQGGIAEEVCPELEGVDALVTDESGLVLLTSHADCVPVYFLDPVHHAVGLAHAGWGGVLAGVVEATVTAMHAHFDTDPAGLRVGIGPHIGVCCFEVREDVLRRFREKSWWHPQLLQFHGENTHIDLAGCIRSILASAGIPTTSVTVQGDCTCCLSETYFSHRGSGGHTGTGAAWIRMCREQAPLVECAEGSVPARRHAPPRRGLQVLGSLVLTMALSLLSGGCGGFPELPPLPGFPWGAGTATTQGALGMDDTGNGQFEALPGLGEVLLEDVGPSRGGTLRLFMSRTEQLNPLDSLEPQVIDAGWFLSDALVTLDETGRVRPLVASEILSSQGGRIWDVMLHEGITFHDGTLLEAKDVVASLTHAASSLNGLYAGNLKNLDQAEAIGRNRIRFILKVPDPLFSQNLSIPLFSESSWTEMEEGEAEIFRPNGIGAFIFEAVDATGMHLSRFEDWWQADAGGPLGHPAWPDKVLFLFGDTEADRLTFFQQRRIDAAWTVDADISRYENRTDIEVRTFAGNRMEFVLFGAKSVPLQREPIRDLLIRYMIAGRPETERSGDLVPDDRWVPLSAAEVIPLLVDAGCRFSQKGDAKPVLSIPGVYGLRTAGLTLRYNALSVERLQSAEWIASWLSEIGIACYLQEIPVVEAKKLVANGQFDLLLLGGEFPNGSTDRLMLEEMRNTLPVQVAEFFPLYRERRAMLYNSRIRGEKNPTPLQVYGGWQEWYLLEAKQGGGVP